MLNLKRVIPVQRTQRLLRPRGLERFQREQNVCVRDQWPSQKPSPRRWRVDAHPRIFCGCAAGGPLGSVDIRIVSTWRDQISDHQSLFASLSDNLERPSVMERGTKGWSQNRRRSSLVPGPIVTALTKPTEDVQRFEKKNPSSRGTLQLSPSHVPFHLPCQYS